MVSILLKNKVLWRGGIPSESETANYMGKTNTNKRAMTNDKVSIIFTFDKNSIWLQMNFIKHHHFIFFVIFMYFFVTIPAKTSETYHQPRFRMTNDEKNFRVKLHNIYMFPAELSGGVLCLDVSTVQYSTVQRWHQYRQHTGWTQVHTRPGLGCCCWPPLEDCCLLPSRAPPARATPPNTI